MQQGKQGLTDYLAEFDRTLLEAGANEWVDTVKIDYLCRGLSQDLINILVSINKPTTYPAFCSKIHLLEQK